jgi:serine/threonine-protein kinase
VKLLSPERQASDAASVYLSRRLLREARITSSVRHDAVVRAIENGVTPDDDPFFVTELLLGRSLERLIGAGRRMPAHRALGILVPIADGLAAAHALGIVHRDVKPENMFLAWGPNRTLHPKLIDFGVAKVSEPNPGDQLTGAGVIGTPGYMSPEQTLDSSSVDPRADVWSFSVVLYEALTGTLPFGAASCTDVLRAVLEREARPLTAFGLDGELSAIVARGLDRERTNRWPSIASLRQALVAWMASHAADC